MCIVCFVCVFIYYVCKDMNKIYSCNNNSKFWWIFLKKMKFVNYLFV